MGYARKDVEKTKKLAKFGLRREQKKIVEGRKIGTGKSIEQT